MYLVWVIINLDVLKAQFNLKVCWIVLFLSNLEMFKLNLYVFTLTDTKRKLDPNIKDENSKS